MEYLFLALFKSKKWVLICLELSVNMSQDKEERLEDPLWVLPFIMLYDSLHCFTALGTRAFIFQFLVY